MNSEVAKDNTCGNLDRNRRKTVIGPEICIILFKRGSAHTIATYTQFYLFSIKLLYNLIKFFMNILSLTYVVVGCSTNRTAFTLNTLPTVLLNGNDHICRELKTSRMT